MVFYFLILYYWPSWPQVAALVPQCELEDSLNWCQVDAHSRLISQALRKIHSSLARSGTLLVLVNQVPAYLYGKLLLHVPFECLYFNWLSIFLLLQFRQGQT